MSNPTGTVVSFPSRQSPIQATLDEAQAAPAPVPALALESLSRSLRRFGIELDRFALAETLMKGARQQGLGDVNMEILHDLMGIISSDAPPAIERAPAASAPRRTENQTAG